MSLLFGNDIFEKRIRVLIAQPILGDSTSTWCISRTTIKKGNHMSNIDIQIAKTLKEARVKRIKHDSTRVLVMIAIVAAIGVFLSLN